MSDNNNARAKKLGELIKNARDHAGRSLEACAKVLDISADNVERAETGEYLVSLPDLEALAIYLKVPMGYFWGTESLEDPLEKTDFSNLIALRQRVIGVLLRQLRLQERRTQKELGEAIGVKGKVIKQYESGKVPIPYLHLEQLCTELGASMEYFADGQRGPLGRHEAELKVRKLFHQLSPELQEFLTNPVNVTYLNTAWRLSEMDVDRLRQIAESLLDITL